MQAPRYTEHIQSRIFCVSALENWASVAASMLVLLIAVPGLLAVNATARVSNGEPSQLLVEVVRAAV